MDHRRWVALSWQSRTLQADQSGLDAPGRLYQGPREGERSCSSSVSSSFYFLICGKYFEPLISLANLAVKGRPLLLGLRSRPPP